MSPITLWPERFRVTALMASRPFIDSGLNVLGARELELTLTDRDTLCLSREVFSLTLAELNNLQISHNTHYMLHYNIICRNCEEMRRILTQGDLWLAPKLSGEMICVTLSCDLCPAPWSCSVCCGDVADTNSCRVNLDNWKVNRKEAPQLQSPVTSTNTVIVMSTPIHTQTVTLSI